MFFERSSRARQVTFLNVDNTRRQMSLPIFILLSILRWLGYVDKNNIFHHPPDNIFFARHVHQFKTRSVDEIVKLGCFPISWSLILESLNCV